MAASAGNKRPKESIHLIRVLACSLDASDPGVDLPAEDGDRPRW